VGEDGRLGAIDRFPKALTRQHLGTLGTLDRDDHSLQHREDGLQQLEEDRSPRPALCSTEPRE